MTWHVLELSKALRVQLLGVCNFTFTDELLADLSHFLKVLHLFLKVGLLLQNRLPLDLINKDLDENRVPNCLVCMIAIVPPYLMVVVLVVLRTQLEPREVAFPHGLECLPQIVLVVEVDHVEAIGSLALLGEVDELAVVESCFFGVVDNVAVFDASGLFGDHILGHVFHHSAVGLFGQVVCLPGQNLSEIVKLV